VTKPCEIVLVQTNSSHSGEQTVPLGGSKICFYKNLLLDKYRNKFIGLEWNSLAYLVSWPKRQLLKQVVLPEEDPISLGANSVMHGEEPLLEYLKRSPRFQYTKGRTFAMVWFEEKVAHI